MTDWYGHGPVGPGACSRRGCEQFVPQRGTQRLQKKGKAIGGFSPIAATYDPAIKDLPIITKPHKASRVQQWGFDSLYL